MFARKQIVLHITGMDEAERAAWEKRLNSHLKECGCRTGAVAALLLAAGVLGHALVGATNLSALAVLSTAVKVLLALFIGGALGKLSGLYAAKLRLRRSCTDLLRRMSVLVRP